MWFGILGPIQVRVGSTEVPIRGRRERILLAMLLIQSNRTVDIQSIVDATWADRPPSNATGQVHGFVYRVRKRLGAAGAPDAITTEAAGYRAQVDPQSVDLLEFRGLRDQARAAAADNHLAEAREQYRAALALWRGPALDGLDSDLVRRAAATLDEERIQVWEECLEVELTLGAAGELVAELTDLVRQHPFREGIHSKLMLALYRAGRQAEALATYRQAHRLLREELGTDPGPDLQQLHQAILNRDQDLVTPKTASASEDMLLPIPRQLPADLAWFIGRVEELKALDALLPGNTTNRPAAVVISAIAGTAGVGKTALAVRWAHRVADKFPNGQLYLNLRGFDPSGPLAPAEAIRAFLDALAVPPQRIPTTMDGQVGLYRSMLAEQQLLIVLDNARDAAQVRPLLPGAPGCLVLITSRNQLSGLAATDGAQLITLGLLAPDDARQLLVNRVGRDRVAAEPSAVDDIVRACAGLPLALAIAAAHAAAQPDFRFATLASRLREASSLGLGSWTTSDPASDLRTVFSWSYRALGANAARLFRLLGLHPGPDATVAAGASLSGFPEPQVRELLAELTEANLLVEHIPGRYTFHDLLRSYAVELAHALDSGGDRQAALHRMLDHYLHSTHAAAIAHQPHRPPLTLAPPQPGVVVTSFRDHSMALAWLTAEHAVLLKAIEQASSNRFDVHTWQLTACLNDFLDFRGYWHDYMAAVRAALPATQRLADQSAQARIRRLLAHGYATIGRFDTARDEYQVALDMCKTLGDHRGEAGCHMNAAWLSQRQDNYSEALSHAERAHELYQAVGDWVWQARALNDIGWSYAHLGEYGKAITFCKQALTTHQEISDVAGAGVAWDSLGYAYYRLGDHHQAIACYGYALDLLDERGHIQSRAETFDRLGDTHLAEGNLDAADHAWRSAVDIFEQLRLPDADREIGRAHV